MASCPRDPIVGTLFEFAEQGPHGAQVRSPLVGTSLREQLALSKRGDVVFVKGTLRSHMQCEGGLLLKLHDQV